MRSRRGELLPVFRLARRRPGGKSIWLAGQISSLALLFAFLMPGGASAQSTTGFKLNLSFESSPFPTLHWVALPYLYTPDDTGSVGVLDAEDLCQDLGDGVVSVVRWDEATTTFEEHSCGDPSPFALVEGIGYGIRVQADWTFLAVLSGSHDDGFAYSIPPSGSSQLTWVSVPYHILAADKPPGSAVTAEDICRQIGMTDALAIVRWNPDLGAYETYGCGSAFEPPFEIVRGEAYGVVNRPDQTIDWQPIHH